MKVLWITNIVFPEAESLLTGSAVFKSSGGWMLGAADALLENGFEINLTVATVSQKVNNLTILKGERIMYYLIPLGKGNKRKNREYEPIWKIINDDVKPDVVHIHGTEFSHGLAYINACGADNVVVSIQGLLSGIRHYYCGGLSVWQVLSHNTLYDIFYGGIFRGQHKFSIRSEYEIELIKNTHHVIGRTSWDRTHVWAINPNAEYHLCNEVLRKEFYDGSLWNFKKCNAHQIFISSASSPLKGFHQLLRAMPLILQRYPNTTIRVAGSNILAQGSFREWLKFSGYAKLISSLIKKYNLNNKVEFAGNLSAAEMKQEYLKCNVFVCPSSIENSPNSLGEAQILGVPIVASFVGGISDMMKGDEENLYRFEETEMLADKICKVFDSCISPNIDMAELAQERHNPNINGKALYDIYTNIM